MIRAAKRAESSSGVKGALTLAATEPEIAITPDRLDAHPYLLNCRNGVVDLRTGELLEHDPALLLTKMAGAPYEPDAEGAVFAEFLERIQPGEDMRLFIRRLLGLSLEGKVTAHVLPIFYGDGANGKSTLTDAVMNALGDYADAADPDLLRARTFDAHPTGVADLFGLRLALVHESDAGHRLAEGTVKRLTGGDRLKARRMREDFWSFDPSHTFVMLTNHKPGVSGTDEGIWRRLRLVPFEVVIPAAERDEDLGGEARRRGRGDTGVARRRLPRLAQERPGRAREGHRGHPGVPGRQRPARPVPRRRMRPGKRIQRPQQPPVRGLREMVRHRTRGPRHAEILRRRHEGQGLRELPVQRHPLARHRPARPGRRVTTVMILEGSEGSAENRLPHARGNPENRPTLPNVTAKTCTATARDASEGLEGSEGSTALRPCARVTCARTLPTLPPFRFFNKGPRRGLCSSNARAGGRTGTTT